MTLRPIYKRSAEYFDTMDEWKQVKAKCDDIETQMRQL